MNAQELFRAGRLAEALKALSAEVRDNPTDPRRRTFLFELLCFSGDYDRADKQLEVLGQAGPQSELGVVLYRAALYAERQRQDLFSSGEYPNKADANPLVSVLASIHPEPRERYTSHQLVAGIACGFGLGLAAGCSLGAPFPNIKA